MEGCNQPRSRSELKRAVALGAALALGGAGLACEEPTVVAPERPHTPEHREAAPVEPTEPDLNAQEARVGRIEASPGFVPDPLEQRGTTSGGTLEASDLDERCQGFIGARPDHLIDADRAFAELAIMVASSEDTTLVIVDSSGDAHCADDSDGTHPVVRETLEAGLYRVWVGTRRQGARAPYVLALSELDAQPSQLAP